MRETLLVVAVACVLLSAGCLGGRATDTPTTDAPTDSPVRGTASPTGSDSPTASATATPEPTPVEYVVEPGDVPDEFARFEVTFRVVFVDDADDLGPCYPDVFEGPYKPTLTPIRTPIGECHASDPVTVDLAELDGPESLGTFMAPASTEGHALIVTDVTARLENGTFVSEIEGIGGAEAIREPNAPSGTYGVAVGLGDAPDGARYDYYLDVSRYDSENDTATPSS